MSAPLERGEALAFRERVVHGSGGDSRERWRREADWRDALLEASLSDDRAETVAALEKRRPNDPQLARLKLLHPADAAKVAVSGQTLRYAQKQFRDEQRWHNIRVGWRNLGSVIADRVFGLVVGYGHKPERSVYMLLALVFAGWKYAARSYRFQEVSVMSPAGVPSFQFKMIIVAAGALLLMQGIAQVFRSILAMKRGARPAKEDDIKELEDQLQEQGSVLAHGSEAIDIVDRKTTN